MKIHSFFVSKIEKNEILNVVLTLNYANCIQILLNSDTFYSISNSYNHYLICSKAEIDP
jgi:hypothetical protein